MEAGGENENMQGTTGRLIKRIKQDKGWFPLMAH
jgi:hypothetical protein